MRRGDIFRLIEGRVAGLPRPCIVGISGVDASGKTCFAKALSEYLEASGHRTALVGMDDFHNPRSVRRAGLDEKEAYIRHAFDRERVVRELLGPARSGLPVDIELTLLDLDRDTFTRKRRYVIDRDTVVVIEGVLLFREPIDGFLDYRIFLDASRETVLDRARKRDVPRYGPAFLDRYRTKYLPIQEWYLSACRPRERSDLVIDNDDYRRPKIVIDRGAR